MAYNSKYNPGPSSRKRSTSNTNKRSSSSGGSGSSSPNTNKTAGEIVKEAKEKAASTGRDYYDVVKEDSSFKAAESRSGGSASSGRVSGAGQTAKEINDTKVQEEQQVRDTGTVSSRLKKDETNYSGTKVSQRQTEPLPTSSFRDKIKDDNYYDVVNKTKQKPTQQTSSDRNFFDILPSVSAASGDEKDYPTITSSNDRYKYMTTEERGNEIISNVNPLSMSYSDEGQAVKKDYETAKTETISAMNRGHAKESLPSLKDQTEFKTHIRHKREELGVNKRVDDVNTRTQDQFQAFTDYEQAQINENIESGKYKEYDFKRESSTTYSVDDEEYTITRSGQVQQRNLKTDEIDTFNINKEQAGELIDKQTYGKLASAELDDSTTGYSASLNKERQKVYDAESKVIDKAADDYFFNKEITSIKNEETLGEKSIRKVEEFKDTISAFGGESVSDVKGKLKSKGVSGSLATAGAIALVGKDRLNDTSDVVGAGYSVLDTDAQMIGAGLTNTLNYRKDTYDLTHEKVDLGISEEDKTALVTKARRSSESQTVIGNIPIVSNIVGPYMFAGAQTIDKTTGTNFVRGTEFKEELGRDYKRLNPEATPKQVAYLQESESENLAGKRAAYAGVNLGGEIIANISGMAVLKHTGKVKYIKPLLQSTNFFVRRGTQAVIAGGATGIAAQAEIYVAQGSAQEYHGQAFSDNELSKQRLTATLFSSGIGTIMGATSKTNVVTGKKYKTVKTSYSKPGNVANVVGLVADAPGESMGDFITNAIFPTKSKFRIRATSTSFSNVNAQSINSPVSSLSGQGSNVVQNYNVGGGKSTPIAPNNQISSFQSNAPVQANQPVNIKSNQPSSSNSNIPVQSNTNVQSPIQPNIPIAPNVPIAPNTPVQPNVPVQPNIPSREFDNAIGFPFAMGAFVGQGKSKRAKKTKPRQYKRTPSLQAVVLDIRAPKRKVKKGEMFTGQEFRPIIDSTVKKKKKKGKKGQSMGMFSGTGLNLGNMPKLL